MILQKQRVVIGMIDGFGADYLEASPMPVMKTMIGAGLFKKVSAVFPTVTNTNNVSICCGAWPKEHGITGNSYFDEATGEADYMESADFIRVPTILELAADRFHLMPERIGELVVLGDSDTVFGEMDIAKEILDPRYRSHGSLHESEVPLLIFNHAVELPSPDRFEANLDLTRLSFGR